MICQTTHRVPDLDIRWARREEAGDIADNIYLNRRVR